MDTFSSGLPMKSLSQYCDESSRKDIPNCDGDFPWKTQMPEGSDPIFEAMLLVGLDPGIRTETQAKDVTSEAFSSNPKETATLIEYDNCFTAPMDEIFTTSEVTQLDMDFSSVDISDLAAFVHNPSTADLEKTFSDTFPDIQELSPEDANCLDSNQNQVDVGNIKTEITSELILVMKPVIKTYSSPTRVRNQPAASLEFQLAKISSSMHLPKRGQNSKRLASEIKSRILPIRRAVKQEFAEDQDEIEF